MGAAAELLQALMAAARLTRLLHKNKCASAASKGLLLAKVMLLDAVQQMLRIAARRMPLL